MLNYLMFVNIAVNVWNGYESQMLPDPRRPPLALQRGAESRVNRHELAPFRLFLCPSAVLKLLKMAKGMRALLDTVMQALPQVNAGPAGGKGRRHRRGNTGQLQRLRLTEADL